MHHTQLESPRSVWQNTIHADWHINAVIPDDDTICATWKAEQHQSFPRGGCWLRLFRILGWNYGRTSNDAKSAKSC